MRLSDSIEQFIKDMLSQEEPEVELKRNELAEFFNCAPSQINYVLATRFTPDRGYAIESRRGGGGYIRIVRIVQTGQDRLSWLLNERIGTSISAHEAGRLVRALMERNAITREDCDLMLAASSEQAMALPVPQNMKDAMRARILKCMILSVAKRQNAGRTEEQQGGTEQDAL